MMSYEIVYYYRKDMLSSFSSLEPKLAFLRNVYFLTFICILLKVIEKNLKSTASFSSSRFKHLEMKKCNVIEIILCWHYLDIFNSLWYTAVISDIYKLSNFTFCQLSFI